MSAQAVRAARVLLAALVFPVTGHAQGRGDDPAGAARYFTEIRAFPDVRIPAGARQAAMAQMKARWPQAFAQRDALASFTPNFSSPTTWAPLGPAPIGSTPGTLQTFSGRLNSIAIDPNNPLRIFVGGAQGGVWRTLDGGSTWTPLADSECSLAMGSIAIDPNNSQVIYAGTGELNNSGDSYYGCGVLKSTNGGNSWTPLGASVFVRTGARSATISKVLVDRTPGSSIVFAASSFGLYRSTDGGTTWALVITDPTSGLPITSVASDIVQDATDPTIFYAAQGNAGGPLVNGVYKSVNSGVSWTKLTGVAPTAFPSTNVGRINLAVSPAAPSTVFAAIEDANNNVGADGSLLGLYVTTDGGTTWTQRTATPPSATNPLCGTGVQCWYDMVIAVDPVNPLIVYFGGFSLYRSIDGGNTFTDIGDAIHADQHAFAFDPTNPATIYAGNDGGIFKATSASTGAPIWTSLNTNLALTQFYAGVSVSPVSATTILGGTQDNGTLQWGGSSNWPRVIGADGGFTAIDQVVGGVMFGETQWTPSSGFSGPRRSDPPGSQFIPKTAGINTADRASFIPPLVMDPARPRIVYFGTTNLYRSANSGDLWTNIGPSLIASSGVINAIGVAASDSLTVYVGSSDARVSYTHDGGTTWAVATGLPLASVTDFAVDARDARTAVVTFGGFPGSHVWRTNDGGVTWTDLTFNLPNIPTLAVVLEPGSRDIDIGTDLGVFTLRNGATSWSPVVNGLPNVAVYDLVFDTQRSRLIAGTHGRGMFSLDVTVVALRGDITADGTVNAADAQAILQSVVGLGPLPVGSIRYPNGDANCDGQVTALDALIVLMKAAGISTGTCVGTTK